MRALRIVSMQRWNYQYLCCLKRFWFSCNFSPLKEVPKINCLEGKKCKWFCYFALKKCWSVCRYIKQLGIFRMKWFCMILTKTPVQWLQYNEMMGSTRRLALHKSSLFLLWWITRSARIISTSIMWRISLSQNSHCPFSGDGEGLIYPTNNIFPKNAELTSRKHFGTIWQVWRGVPPPSLFFP